MYITKKWLLDVLEHGLVMLWHKSEEITLVNKRDIPFGNNDGDENRAFEKNALKKFEHDIAISKSTHT